MSHFKTQPRELADWLESVFGAPVEIIDDLRRGLFLFRIRLHEKGDNPGLEVTEEALEDWTLDEISHDLESQALVEWLRPRATYVIRYQNDRELRHFEQLEVDCPTGSFRVVRDANGQVHFFDVRDKKLNVSGTRIANWSIQRKSAAEWCREIEQLLDSS